MKFAFINTVQFIRSQWYFTK